MATLDPETIDLKKSLLDAASRNKVSIFTPTPEVPVDPAIAAEYAKAADLAARSKIYQDRQNTAWVADSDLTSATGLAKQAAARFLEAVPGVLSRGSAYFDWDAQFQYQNLDPRALAIAKQAGAYEDEQARIKEAKTRIFKDSMSGRLTPEQANEQLLQIPDQVLGELRKRDNNPERAFTPPVSEEQNAFLDSPRVLTYPDGRPIESQIPVTHRALLENYYKTKDRGAAYRQLWKDATPEGIANSARRDEFALQVPKILDESGARENFGRAGEALAKKDYETVAKELFAGVSKAAIPGAKAVASRPGLVFEELVGSVLPEIMPFLGPIGPIGGTASSVGYAGQIYQDGVKAYEEKYGKDSLSQEDAKEIAAWSAAAGALNFASAGVLLKPLKGLPLSPKVKEIVDGVAKSIDLTPMLDKAPAIVRAPTKAVAKTALETGRRGGEATIEGTVESAAEIGQQAIEDNLSKLNTDFDAEKLTTAGLLGLAGGVGAAVPAALNPTGLLEKSAEKAKQRQAARAEADAAKRTSDEQFAHAVETGDVAPMLNQDGAQYSPGRAVEALTKRIVDKELSDEDKASHIQQIAEISQKLDEEQTVLKPLADAPGLQQRLDAVNERLASLPEEDPTRTRFETAAKTLQEHIDNAPKVQERLATVEQELARIKGAEVLLQGTEPRIQEEDVSALVSQVEQPQAAIEQLPDAAVEPSAEPSVSPQESTVAAAEKIISLAMERPNALSDEILDRLVANEDNALDEIQRDTLRKLSAARQAQNALKDKATVQQEIFTGGNGNLGLKQYQDKVATSLRGGEYKKAQDLVAQLGSFQKSHARKLALVQQALEHINKQPNLPDRGSRNGATYLISDDAAPNGWRLSRAKPVGWDATANGGRTLWHTKKGQQDTQAFLDAIKAESTAIDRTYEYLQDAVTQHEAKASSRPGTQPVTPDMQETAQTAPQEVVQPDTAEVTQEATQTAEQIAEAPEAAEEATAIEAEPVVTEVEATVAVEEPSATESTTDGTPAIPGGVEYASGSLPGIATPGNKIQGHLSLNQLRGNAKAGVARVNQILAYFKQSADASRPLVAMKDFMSNWEKVPELFQHFLPEKARVRFNDSQEILANKFQAFFKKADAFLVQNMVRADQEVSEYANKDWTYYLNELGDDGKLAPENVRAAIAMAAFTWVTEEARGNGISTPDQIRAQMGLDKQDKMPPGALRALYDAGTFRRLVQRNLGRRALQALGLKALADAPVNSQKQLELALGNHALALLFKTGWIEEHGVDGTFFPKKGTQSREDRVDEDTAVESDSTKPVGRVPTRPFIRIKRDDKRKPVSKALKDLADASKGNSSALTSLFGVDPSRRYVSLEPGKWNQKTIKGTNASVPPEQAKVLKKVSGQAHKVSERMVHVLKAVPREILREAFGYVSPDADWVHADNIFAIESRNSQIEQDLDYLLELIDELSDIPGGLANAIYLIPQVWQVQRAGLESTTVNPQTSKVQRPFIDMDAAVTDLDETTAPEVLDQFKLAVAQGLGVKVGNLSLTESLNRLNDKLELPEIKAALAALTKMLDGKPLDVADHKAIAAGMDTGKEKGHSLKALVELAGYELAKSNGETFSTSLPLEADGITNGPALLHLMLGLVDTNLGEKFGFYTAKSGINSFSEWRSLAGSQDLYESLMVTMGDSLEQVYASNPELREQLDLLGNLIDPDTGLASSAGRNFTKPIVTPTGFGASIKKVLTNVAEGFADNFTETLQAIAKNKNLTPEGRLESMQDVVKTWNRVFMQGTEQLWVPRTIQEGLGKVREGGNSNEVTRLSNAQRRAVLNSYQAVVAPHIKTALDAHFGSFFAARKAVNNAGVTMFEMYQQAYDALMEYKIRQKVHAGKLPRVLVNDPEGPKDKKMHAPVQDLTQAELEEIEQILAPIFPRVHTAMSKTTSTEEAGLELLNRKTKEPPNYFKQAYLAETKMPASPTITRTGEQPLNAQSNPKNYSGVAEYETLEGPGAATSVVQTHATDSAIATRTYGEVPALNIHDGLIFGIKDAVRGSQKLNQNTFELLLNFSQPLELLATWDRMISNLDAIKKLIPDFKPNAGLFAQKRDTFATFAYQAEWNKLGFLAQVAVVDQYPLSGGAYQITAADQTKVKERRAEIRTLMEQEGITPGAKPVSTRVEPVRILTERQGQVSSASTKKDASVQPVVATQEVSVTDWNHVAKNAGTAKRLIAATARHVPASLRPLAGALARHPLVQSLAVHLADETAPDEIQGDKTSMAKAVVENGQVVGVYLWPERALAWKGSFGPAIALIHELVHAVTVPALKLGEKLADVARGIDKKLYHKQDTALQAEMLLQHVQGWVTNNQETLTPEESGEVTHALKNRYELLAWGSSSPVIQQMLQRVPSITNKKSVFDNLVDLFLKALGLGSDHQSALRDVFRLVARSSAESAKATKAASTEVGTVHLPMTAPNQGLQEMSVEQVYDALAMGSHRVTDPVHDRNLRNALAQVVRAVYGPAGVVPGFVRQAVTTTGIDTLFNSIMDNSMPFASKASGRILLNSQEKFVLESVEVTTREALNNSQVTREELRRLFRDAKEQIGPEAFFAGDWNQATDEEINEAKAIHEFIFTLERNADNTSDFLSRFAAMGIAYAPLQRALTRVTSKAIQAPSNATLWQKLVTLWDKAMRELAQRISRTSSDQYGDQRLVALVRNLARLETKRKIQLAKQGNTATNALNGFMRNMSDKAHNKLQAIGALPSVTGSGYAPVRLAGTLARAVGGRNVDKLVVGLQTLRNKNKPNQQLGFPSELLNEIRGAQSDTVDFYKLLQLAKTREQERKNIANTHKQAVLDNFLKMSKAESAAMTHAVVRGDMVALLGPHTEQEIIEMLRDPNTRAAAIQKLEQQLQSEQEFDFYVTQARGLAYQMMLGETRLAGQARNAYAIARLFGQNKPVPTGKRVSEIQAIVDQLTSLYAMEYMSSETRVNALRVIDRETSRSDGNGFLFLLKLHENLKAEAEERLFADSPEQFAKGYTRDLTNPHIDLKVVTETEMLALEHAGYTQVSKLKKDKADPDQEQRYLYAIEGLGLTPLVTTAMSFTGTQHRGTATHSGLTSYRFDGIHHVNYKTTRDVQNKHLQIASGYKAATFDPRKTDSVFMTPVFNGKGEIVNHRYLMNENTKNTLLERMNDVDEVIGAMSASTFDKASTPALNSKIIKALHEQYKADIGVNSEAYVEVSEFSSDPKLREIYRRLPDSAKREIRSVWGGNAMMVRNDILLLTFGYRKIMFADMVDKRGTETGNDFQDAARDLLIKTLVVIFAWDGRSLTEGTFEDEVRLMKAKLRMKKVEEIWETLVQFAKDNVVIKNFVTLWDNQLSNMSLLFLMGVPAKDIVKYMSVGLLGVLAYQRDAPELRRLELDLKTGLLSPQERARTQQRIIELEDALLKNPVRGMVEAGMLQAIVEDVSQEDDPFSFQSKLAKKVGEQYARLPNKVQQVGKFVAMTHDTKLYKFLHQSTALSDFVARYAVIQHMTTRAENPMSLDEAQQFAVKAFIHYDSPTHPYMQKANDMGAIFFTKYYLRIQAVLFQVMQDNPGKTMAMAILANLFPALPFVTESGFWHRLGNPLDSGALKYFETLDEPITMQLLISALPD